MPSTCTFAFDRPIYYSGETINGRITLQTDKEKTVRGVYIVFNGGAKVHWVDTSTTSSNGRTQHHRHDRNGSDLLDNAVYNPIGYIVFASGLQKMSKIPVQGENIKYFCCWPCSSGPVISTLTILFGGWAPGQEITYDLEIDNQSRAFDLSGTDVKLVQTYQFTANDRLKCHNNTLAQLEHADSTVMRLSKRIFEGKLRIPPVPPSYLGNGIINVSYRIEMCIHTDNCHEDSEIRIPITIGTIPLAQTATNPNYIIPLPATAPPPDTPDSLDMPPRYDICMPPTFEEATHIGVKFKDTDKNDYQNKSTGDWIPKYPMHTYFSVPATPPIDNFSVTTPASAPQTDINEQRDVMENRSLLSVGLNTNILPQSAPYASTSYYPQSNSTAEGFFGIPRLSDTLRNDLGIRVFSSRTRRQRNSQF